MSDIPATDARRYHHGDLSRALVDAARRLLEAEGQSALSLRAVAREAGVSPAAPYHHFKDKGELLAAVAQEGWTMLAEALAKAKDNAPNIQGAMTELGVAYVCFANDNPALYRVMYETARNKEALPERMQNSRESPYAKVRDILIEVGADPNDSLDLELATSAAWCSAHGLAEMTGFRQFDHLKTACGGETAFIRAIFNHMGLAPNRR